jgi:hypothetical protein
VQKYHRKYLYVADSPSSKAASTEEKAALADNVLERDIRRSCADTCLHDSCGMVVCDAVDIRIIEELNQRLRDATEQDRLQAQRIHAMGWGSIAYRGPNATAVWRPIASIVPMSKGNTGRALIRDSTLRLLLP